ncbi:hypothetical protein [Pseudactinotalea sp. Z1732]|uniref:hypothetical protein n=1 Tax=Micrococcales TaxID=85006 RepID=UPI003C7DE91F
MASTGLERKVRQLDNDVQSIYELLAAIQGTQLRQGNRLDELDERLAGLDERMAGLDGRVAGIDEKVTDLAEGMATVLELLRAR